VKTAVAACWSAILLAFPNAARCSDWLKSPQPKYPSSALKNYTEGFVRLRIVIGKDGSVLESKIIKGSGDPTLDRAAQEAVLKWKMKPTAIKASDLTKGREAVIEFRQQASIAARYPDRVAYFESKDALVEETQLSKLWMFAPFPSYPFEARALRQQGTVRIRLTIADDGTPKDIQLAQSSGYPLLDQCAIRAVALWRAHKQYAGRQIVFPIAFVLARHRF
jgi:TonB family protein